MRLAEYLKAHGISQKAFARRIGRSVSYVNSLCADPPDYWPGRDVALRIRDATEGAVTPNDFLPAPFPEPRRRRRRGPAPHMEAAE